MGFIDRTGEIGVSNQGLNMIISEYRGSLDIDVRFDDGFISKNKTYGNFKKGEIKNPYFKNIFGVGFIGEGKYKSTINLKNKIQYKTWISMIQRCYNEKYQEKYPTYRDCSVCEEWHNFQNFSKWFDDNYYQIYNENICIDKDIAIKGNKVYSPDTCIFVPNDINMLFVKRQNKRGKYPLGVSYNNHAKKYQCSLKKNRKNINLGYFDTPEEAFQEYKKEKELYIKQVADEYKDKIPMKLYDALYKYKVEITD